MKYKFGIIIISVVLLASCKTTRTATTTKQASLPQSSQVEQLVKQVQSAEPKFETANVSKMVMELNVNDRNFNVSAACKIKKDSAIYLSIRPLFGIEAFKAELTPDSMKVIDKLNFRYFVVDYHFFKQRFGVDVDFYSLQGLIFNQFFCVGQRTVQPQSLQLNKTGSGNNAINFESETMQQSTEINSLNLIQQVILKAKSSGYQLQTTYADFAVENTINIPHKISMTASSDKSKAVCNFSILRVDFNNKLTFSATNTDRYTRGDIEQLMKK
ncbi:MAG: DUF4292 domain-containing protein [Paludibacter sp.]|nr:DUF4292 domain-containing protein [Paludibacter sp.]